MNTANQNSLIHDKVVHDRKVIHDRVIQTIAIDLLCSKLITWQQQHGRHDLPWQHPATPYRVLVSEVMLQQTQVATVIPYFERWMQRFPRITDLAQASEDDVMQLWQGLGYYSRARNLRKAAIYLQTKYNGDFPNTIAELLKVPAVGRYTAGALASFAFNQYGPIVDGNVKRFFCRLFAIEGVPTDKVVEQQLWQIAKLVTPQQNNRAFAQGLLDMGATLCRPKKPLCDQCPFEHHCQAKRMQRIEELPTAKPKKILPNKAGVFLWIQQEDKLLLVKRPSPGIWGGLWCLPEYPLTEALSQALAPSMQQSSSSLPSSLLPHSHATACDSEHKGDFKHTFTHYRLHASIWQTSMTSLDPEITAGPVIWLRKESLTDVGLPAPIKKFIRKNL